MELSLPTAVFSAFLGSTILLVALIHIGKMPGAPKGLIWWILGIALNTVRFLAQYWAITTSQITIVFLSEALQVVGSLFLVAGSLVFLGRLVWWNMLAGVCLFAITWSAYTTLLSPNFLLRSIPMYFLSGGAVVWVGIAFIRARNTGDNIGYSLTGTLFIMWGLHKINFPLLRQVEWFAPYGFLIAMGLFMGITVSLIVIAQRRMLFLSKQEVQERLAVEAELKHSEGRYQRLFENSEISIWHEDMSEVIEELARLRNKGVTNLRQYLERDLQLAWDLVAKVKVLHVNEASNKLFGANCQLETTFGANTINVFIDQLCAIWDKRSFFRAEATFQTFDGKHIDGIISFLIPDTPEGFSSIPVSILDITERKQFERSLRTSETRYRKLIEDMPDLLYRTDVEGMVSYASPSIYKLTGYMVDEIIGMKLAKKVYVHPEQRELFLAELKKNGYIENFESQCFRKDGSTWWGSTNAHFLKGDDGSILGVEGVVRDISEKKIAEEKLSYQASHDLLTGLINRHEFERRIERLLATFQQNKDEHAMCFMDLDQFKVINDTCGHIAGDELLRQLCSVLQVAVRSSDTLARLGGDEFGVLMDCCSLEQAHRVADNLLKSIQDFQFCWEGQSFRIGVSIGLVAITETTPNLTELLKQADVACYMAKELGRNRIHVHHPKDTELALRHGEMQWVSRIDRALEENRFCLYAQPIVPLDGSNGKHYELLVRMVGEDGEIIPPGAFLPAAERYNLIEKIDAWVIKNAFSLLASNPGFIETVNFISINLSGPSLTNNSFLDSVVSELKTCGIEANKICFEVTETVAISNLKAAIVFISVLKELGCRFALDDFGSGLSSFAYLKNLPVDYLKIDGIFVKDIVGDPIDRAMVKSINDIGQVMGMRTIAEFVENDEIKGMLKAIGVNYAQGYGLGKPQPFNELLDCTDADRPIKLVTQ